MQTSSESSVRSAEITQENHKENIVLPAEMNSETLAEYVAKESVGILKRLDVLKPYFQELWKRFDALKEGEAINGCYTRTEFCEKVLHRSRRSVQYILYGRPAPKPYEPTADKPLSELTNDELLQRWNGCKDIYLNAGFPAATPDIPKPKTPTVNKHLVGARVGDKLLLNSSSGTATYPITAIDDEYVTVFHGQRAGEHKYPLDIDSDTLRANVSKRIRDTVAAANAGDTKAVSELEEAGLGLDGLPRETNCVERGTSSNDINSFGGTRRKNYYSHEYIGREKLTPEQIAEAEQKARELTKLFPNGEVTRSKSGKFHLILHELSEGEVVAYANLTIQNPENHV